MRACVSVYKSVHVCVNARACVCVCVCVCVRARMTNSDKGGQSISWAVTITDTIVQKSLTLRQLSY